MAPKTLAVTARNNIFQKVETLKRNREKRNSERLFVVEGVALLNSLMAHDWQVEAFLFARGAKLSDWARGLLASNRAHVHYELHPELMDELSDKEETSELLALVRIPEDDPEKILVKNNDIVIVFDRPNNPGNLGSSLRSCDCFGIKGAFVTGHAADIYHPHAVRGTMGALFGLPVVRVPSQTEIVNWVEKTREHVPNLKIIGTSAKAEKMVDECDLTGPVLIVAGNETFGMSKGWWAACDETVKIPIGGVVSSLNVSCALSIVLYEAVRQRYKERRRPAG